MAKGGVFVLDSENSGFGDKMEGKKTAKGSSLGSATMRKGLADISNLPQQAKHSSQDEKPQPVSLTTKEYIDELHKENMALMKLLVDRNKIIELSGIELQKLRVNLQKVQQQNWQLAQANSHMLAELNSGKDRLKALQHELGCKNSLLKAKNMELEEKAKTRTCQNTGNEVGTTKCEEAGESSLADKDDNKPCNTNRGKHSKNQSLGPSTVKQVQTKEKAGNKRLSLRRQSARFKSEGPEPTGNKRLRLRRQSARFESEEPEPAEDLFEIDDTKFLVCPLGDDTLHEYGPSMGSSVKREDKEGNNAPRYEAQEFRRSSMGRPMRRAVERVQSYKEIPLNMKMRRNE